MPRDKGTISYCFQYFVDHCLANWVLTIPKHVSPDGKQRNYQLRSDTPHVYLFGGRLFFVKQKPYSVVLGLVLVATGILYWVFEAPWAWHHQSPAVVLIFSYLWFLSVSFFIRSSTSDPGIQPRNAHLPFDPIQIGSNSGPDEYNDTITLPYRSNRYIGVNVKYCPTCHIWRMPRMSHCVFCNVCVEKHDHHCVYLNNCIGCGNYRYFLWFLLTIVITSIYLSVFMFLRCFRYHNGDHDQLFKDFIRESPVTFLLAILSLIGLVYPSFLLVFHLYLTANNMTTREYLNYARGNSDYVNVFDTSSVWRNLVLNWCSLSYETRVNDPRAKVDNNLLSTNLPPLSSFSHTTKVK